MVNNLEKAIDHFGTKAKLAKELGVSPMVVYQWSKRNVPAERASQIERISKGAVKASDLRPDIFINNAVA